MSRLPSSQLIHQQSQQHPAFPPMPGSAPPPQQPPVEAAFEVDLLEIVRAIWRRRWIVMGVTILAMIFSIIAALFWQTDYTSYAQVMIDNRKYGRTDSLEISYLEVTDEVVETEISVLTSRSIMSQAAMNAHLTEILQVREQAQESAAGDLFSRAGTILARRIEENLPGLASIMPEAWFQGSASAPQEPLDLNDAILFLYQQMTARQVGNTSVIEISFTDEDPDISAHVANVMAQTYIASQIDFKQRESADTTGRLNNRINELQTILSEKRAELQRLRARVGAVDSGGSLSSQQQLSTNERLLETQSERFRLEAQIDSLERQLSTSSVLDIANQVDTPLMGQLRLNVATANQRLAELQQDYGPRHPVFLDAQAQLDRSLRDIETEARQYIASLRTEISAFQREEGQLRARLNDINRNNQALGADRAVIAALESEVLTTETLLEDAVTRAREADDQSQALRSDARQISQAVPPDYGNFPSRKVIVAGGTMAGFFLGILIAFMRDGLDRSLRSVEEAERVLQVPILGSVPIIKGRKTPLRYAKERPGSAFVESIRTLLTNIGLRPNASHAEILLVTSAVASEGKSSVVSVTAQQMQRAGYRVAVIECDLRRPSLGKVFQAHEHIGLIQYLEGGAGIGDILQRCEFVNGITFVAAGGTSDNSLYQLQSAQMKQLVDWLVLRHDLVILDTPPVLALPDAQALAEIADHILYLCRWGATSKQASQAGVRMLLRRGGAPVYAALSQVDMKSFGAYDDTYGDMAAVNRYYTD